MHTFMIAWTSALESLGFFQTASRKRFTRPSSWPRSRPGAEAAFRDALAEAGITLDSAVLSLCAIHAGNLAAFSVVPLVDQQGFSSSAMNESGLGDVLASQFFSPKAPTASGWIWGVGPAELLPTASDEALGAEFVVGDIPAEMKARAEEMKYPFPYLIDETQAVSAAFGGTTTIIPFAAQHRGTSVTATVAIFHAVKLIDVPAS